MALTPLNSFGIDLNVAPDLGLVFGLAKEQDCLRQDLLHRYTTPRGSLFYDANYGYDVRQWLGRPISTRDAFHIAAGLTNETRQDDRVKDAKATVSVTSDGFTADITVVTTTGPFTLTLKVTPEMVSLL